MEFVIARNPDPDSSLPYLVRVPLGPSGIAVKVRDTWPRTSKVYCHRADEWPDDIEVLERIPVRSCVRRGAAIDLVLDRAREHRSVVEDRWSSVFKLERVRPAVVADGLAEAQIRFPNVPIVFCETRPLAQEWTYRYLGAALAHHHETRLGTERSAELPVAGKVPDAAPAAAEVRAWAREHGIPVPDRGRLRPEVHAAFHAARSAGSDR